VAALSNQPSTWRYHRRWRKKFVEPGVAVARFESRQEPHTITVRARARLSRALGVSGHGGGRHQIDGGSR
jgi:hypothetical protein